MAVGLVVVIFMAMVIGRGCGNFFMAVVVGRDYGIVSWLWLWYCISVVVVVFFDDSRESQSGRRNSKRRSLLHSLIRIMLICCSQGTCSDKALLLHVDASITVQYFVDCLLWKRAVNTAHN